jgi:hypothetical protein
VTSAKEVDMRIGQSTNLILETRFVENAGTFSYIFSDLQDIESRKAGTRKEVRIQKGRGLCPLE